MGATVGRRAVAATVVRGGRGLPVVISAERTRCAAGRLAGALCGAAEGRELAAVACGVGCAVVGEGCDGATSFLVIADVLATVSSL